MMHFRGTGEIGRYFYDGFGHTSSFLHDGWGFVILGIGLLVAALIVITVVVLIKKSYRTHPAYQADESIELLNARYAKGELNEEDCMRMKKVLLQR